MFRAKGTAGTEFGGKTVYRRNWLEATVQRRFLETAQKRVTLRPDSSLRLALRRLVTIPRDLDLAIRFFQRNSPGARWSVQFEEGAVSRDFHDCFYTRKCRKSSCEEKMGGKKKKKEKKVENYLRLEETELRVLS